MSTEQRFQCFLIQAYQCAKSKDILMEADRVITHTSHIEHPRTPNWYHGSPLAVQAAIDELMAKPQKVRRKDSTIQSRKPRYDYRGLLACVSSYPVAVETLRHASSTEKKLARSWVADVDEFVKSEFEDAYVGAVIHSDETFPHVHHFVVGASTHLHPGSRAELIDGHRIDDNQERIRKYKKGLSDFLDRFHARVGIKYGHVRKGNIRPSPRIRDRKTWLVEKEAARLFHELGDADAEARARYIFNSRDSRQRG